VDDLDRACLHEQSEARIQDDRAGMRLPFAAILRAFANSLMASANNVPQMVTGTPTSLGAIPMEHTKSMPSRLVGLS